ncbi:hypothetical protein [Paenirhodobacter sp. CAU 1674]|uniref:hypothetical protein n=1 Tax=Paenirhodobacter sp. CAU 1674 TaxID=3032596 RepID=UPI0023DCDAB4|nr:hypothetical protein [Paenirhodobacter sp. CAU 1674]MDF2140283.1 hypothetical protein [Paenirhodobacter sp. CAU 1674]
MRIRLALGLGTLGIVAACAAPAPTPIMPEPIYDKYGDVVTAGCRPRDTAISAQYPGTLPICEELCGPGQTAAASDVAGQYTCVPIREPNEGRDSGDTDQQPTRG